jgi:predicted tellurium resistance membrane protein TerC
MLTLSFLEIVLGIDISFLFPLSPVKYSSSDGARNPGLLLALFFRIALLLSISWIIRLKKPVLMIPSLKGIWDAGIGLSYKHLILVGGGLFLIIKSRLEIRLGTPPQESHSRDSYLFLGFYLS